MGSSYINYHDPPLLPEDAHLTPWLPPYRGKIDTSDGGYMKLHDEREQKRKLALEAYQRAVDFRNQAERDGLNNE